jgi:ferric-dicitrate binding protein FerR (iron transport regulator)
MEEEDYGSLQNHPENDPDLTGTERVIADNTRMLFESVPQEKLPEGEKDRIWNRIIGYAQIPKADTRKRLFRLASWYRVAAVVTLISLAGVGYKLLKRPDSDVMKQAASSVSIESTETRLMLADSRTIHLKGENSDVVYQNDLIRIDSSGVEKNVSPAQKDGLNTLVVPYGKRSRITLSDGTKIWLNSGSRLVYPSEFAEGKRAVYLDGQAYFAVAHDTDRPFYVQTDRMDIKVLGTEFDVSSYEDDNKVSAVLAKGSIELLTQKDSFWGSQRSKMVPGTRAVYDEISERAQIDKVNVYEYISWKDGYLIANHQTLNEVFKKLSRYYKYDFTIQDEEVGMETFSGSLDLHEDIDQMVIGLADATSLKYHKSERRFIFEKKDTSSE